MPSRTVSEARAAPLRRYPRNTELRSTSPPNNRLHLKPKSKVDSDGALRPSCRPKLGVWKPRRPRRLAEADGHVLRAGADPLKSNKIERRGMGKLRWATSEAILQHIGRVYFRRQRVYVYHIFYPDGTEYRVLYDWLWFGSDYTHFHPELDSRGVCYCSSPHMIITAIHDGVTRGGGPGSKPRQFSIKTMIYVMGKSLAEWEDLGNCSHASTAPAMQPLPMLPLPTCFRCSQCFPRCNQCPHPCARRVWARGAVAWAQADRPQCLPPSGGGRHPVRMRHE